MNNISDSLLYGQNNATKEDYVEFVKYHLDRMAKVFNSIEGINQNLINLLQTKQRSQNSVFGIPFVTNKNIPENMFIIDEAHHRKLDPWQYERLLNCSLLDNIPLPRLGKIRSNMALFEYSMKSNDKQRTVLIENMMAETVYQPNINLNRVHLPSVALPQSTAKQKLLYQVPAIKGFNYDPSSSSNTKPTAVDRILAKQVR